MHADTKPFAAKRSGWDGYFEVVYSCGHTVLIKRTAGVTSVLPGVIGVRVPAGCLHEAHSPPAGVEYIPADLAPDRGMALADTRPVATKASWPGSVEVVYSCGHFLTQRLTDDVPANCVDFSHRPPPAQTPAVLPDYPEVT